MSIACRSPLHAIIRMCHQPAANDAWSRQVDTVRMSTGAPLGMTATRLGGRQARRTVFSLLVWLTQMTAWQSARLNFNTWTPQHAG